MPARAERYASSFEPHFRSLALEPTLDKFRANLEGFVRYLEKEWGSPVRARVVASVLRGDRTCKYRIELKR